MGVCGAKQKPSVSKKYEEGQDISTGLNLVKSPQSPANFHTNKPTSPAANSLKIEQSKDLSNLLPGVICASYSSSDDQIYYGGEITSDPSCFVTDSSCEQIVKKIPHQLRSTKS